MNRVLYLIIGGSVAGVMALALFEKQNSGSVSSTDFRAVIGFCLTMAAAACFLIYSRLGRHWRQRLDQKTMDEDDRVHSNALTKGEVRPPLGS